MPNRIKELREARGLTLDQVAEIANTTNQQVSMLENGRRRLTDNWMRRLAPAFGVGPSALMDPAEPAMSLVLPAPPKPGEPQRPISRDLLVGARDLPVYGCAQGGEGDVIIVDDDPIEWVLRPEPLFNVPGGFAIYLVGDSMEPVYRQGDRVLIHPSLPTARGEDAMLVRQLPVGFHALVKRVVSWDRDKWNLRQFNPAKDFSLPRTEWPLAYSVVGKYNRR